MGKRLKYIKANSLFLGTAFLLLFIPLYPKFPLFPVQGTYVHVRLEDVFVALAVVLLVLSAIKRRSEVFWRQPVFKLVVLFWAIGLLSVASAVLVTKNVQPHLALIHFVRRVEYLSLLWVAYFSLRDKKQIKAYLLIIGLATIGVVAYGLGQKFLGWKVVSTMNAEFSRGMILDLTWWARINSTFAGHYDLAAYMVMVFPIFLLVAIAARTWIIKTGAAFLMLFSYYIILLTASRISFAAYLLAGCFMLIATKKRWWLVPFLALSITGMIFAGDLGQRYAATFKVDLSFLSGAVKVQPEQLAAGPRVVAPALTPVDSGGPVRPVRPGEPSPTPTPTETSVATDSGVFKDYSQEGTVMATSRSTDIRLKVEWPRALRAFAKNPLLGTGYSSITLATDNDYLRILGETGILGTLAFLLLILELLRRYLVALNPARSQPFTRLFLLAVIASSIGYFINAGFIDVWEASKLAFFFWILVGLGLKMLDLDLKSHEK